MTDYFVLLDQPRQPWLDLAQLKEAFHRKTLRAHPDAQPKGNENSFAELNEAYQVLRDPRRRLQHLLALQGDEPSQRTAMIPVEIEALFPTIAVLMREAQTLTGKQGESALGRSLVTGEAAQLQGRLTNALEEMFRLRDEALTRLQQVRPDDLTRLQSFYLLFSYLSRWIAQVEEKQLQLPLSS